MFIRNKELKVSLILSNVNNVHFNLAYILRFASNGLSTYRIP